MFLFILISTFFNIFWKFANFLQHFLQFALLPTKICNTDVSDNSADGAISTESGLGCLVVILSYR